MLFTGASNFSVPWMQPQFARALNAGGGGGGGITLVAHTATGGSVSGAATSGINTSGANLIVVLVNSYAVNSEPTLTDSLSNTYIGLTARSSTTPRTRLFYCASPSVGSAHTFSVSGANSYGTLAVAAFSGVNATPFDVQNGATNSSTSIQTGSVTPSVSNSLLLAGVNFNAVGATVSIDSGFTIMDQVSPVSGVNFGIGFAYLIQATASAINPTWTPSAIDPGGLAACIATFKP